MQCLLQQTKRVNFADRSFQSIRLFVAPGWNMIEELAIKHLSDHLCTVKAPLVLSHAINVLVYRTHHWRFENTVGTNYHVFHLLFDANTLVFLRLRQNLFGFLFGFHSRLSSVETLFFLFFEFPVALLLSLYESLEVLTVLQNGLCIAVKAEILTVDVFLTCISILHQLDEHWLIFSRWSATTFDTLTWCVCVIYKMDVLTSRCSLISNLRRANLSLRSLNSPGFLLGLSRRF